MLTKAILTGGVLSVLAGSIVYFGTEGADALVKDVHEDVRLDDTELAGAAETVEELVHPHGTASSEPSVKEKKKAAKKAKAEAEALAEEAKAQAAEAKALAEKAEMQAAEAQATESENPVVESVAQAEPQDETDAVETPQAKPKTRWLDQYLKSDKAKETEAKPADVDADAQEDAQESEEAILEVEDKVEVETEVEVETGQKMMAEIETETESQAENAKTIEKKIVVEIEGDENFVWSSADEVELEMLEELLGESEITKDALKKEIRIIKLGDKGHGAKKHHHSSLSPIDYDAVLVEAKKLQVIDMRNEAFLEIVDYAIDRGDIGDAADIVDELSSPELRDTARARIGVGLATSGDMEAAFAVLDEIEIDELSAPIRLEIISALMATRAERAASKTLR